jgi:hypothetical protein
MAKKQVTTIYITETQQQMLRELNRRTKVPVAEYIREGIDMILQRHRDLLPGQMVFGILPLGADSAVPPLESEKV